MWTRILYTSLLISILSFCTTECRRRNYFIAIEEIEWDYAPSGMNLIKNTSLENDEDAVVFVAPGRNRIGRKYKKAVYRAYTDATFTTAKLRPNYLGILGPMIKAEVGDVLIVHASNLASKNYSIHPHGVFYTKENEGALYYDKTHSSMKSDDSIPPGGSFTYEWEVRKEYGPAPDDPNCLTYSAHSHIRSPKDTNTGLVAPLLVCRPGTLDHEGNRLDVDKEFALILTVFDENESWYLSENIQKYCSNPDSVDTTDEDFKESNKMHGINGLMYGNLQISVSEGDTVSWHLIGMGTEADIHSMRFQGQTVVVDGHRQDTVSLFPAIFTTATMDADNAGQWEITCLVNDHLTAGMNAILNVNVREHDNHEQYENEFQHQEVEHVMREYFLGIQEIDWNYAPSGMNTMSNETLTANNSDSKTFFEKGTDRIGGTYKKAVYRLYSSSKFEREMRGESDEALGILGPVIATEVGESIRVTVKNLARTQTYNIEPHGLYYDDVTHLAPGEQHTYVWEAPNNVAPTDLDDDCITYLYTSTVDQVKDTNSGLVGPLLVCKQGTMVQRLDKTSYYLLFTVFDENLSHYLTENIERYTTVTINREDEDFKESNLMHSINGLMYGNLNGVKLCLNTENYINMIGLGTEVDMHAMVIFGQIMEERKENSGVIGVFPHTTATTIITPHEAGKSKIYCSTSDHYTGGMKMWYTVHNCSDGQQWMSLDFDPRKTRTYYIGVVETVWNYFPRDTDAFGDVVGPDSDLYVFTKKRKGKSIGSSYKKALFYEYTNRRFKSKKGKELHSGMLGPVISAEAGDRIRIVFKNMASRPYSMKSLGIIDEGAMTGGIVSANPGETVTYYWDVPDSAAPRPDQIECNIFMYVSGHEPMKDIDTGLIGPLKICRRGILSGGKNKYADREFYLLFLVHDENNNHYLDDNIRRFMRSDPDTIDKEDEDFKESNLMHAINGRLEHLENLIMYEGERVIWYLMGLGNEVDLHTVHFHAHAFTHESDKTRHSDVFNLYPGRVATLEMYSDPIGDWLLHCHVNDHMNAGMRTTYTVLEYQFNPQKTTSCTIHRSLEAGRFDMQCVGLNVREMLSKCAKKHVKMCMIRLDDTNTWNVNMDSHANNLPMQLRNAMASYEEQITNDDR